MKKPESSEGSEPRFVVIDDPMPRGVITDQHTEAVAALFEEIGHPPHCSITLDPPISTKVEVQDGKYCFVSEGDGTVKCLRYGEEWLTFDKGRNALIALIHHTASLEANETINP